MVVTSAATAASGTALRRVAAPLRRKQPARVAKKRRTVVASSAAAAGVSTEERAALRSILRAVHPDRCCEAVAREVNGRSLSGLNAYIDAMRGGRPRATLPLRFLVQAGGAGCYRELKATLKSGGSLTPLLAAWRSFENGSPQRAEPSSPLSPELGAWLGSRVAGAALVHEAYEERRVAASARLAALRDEFQLPNMHLGYVASSAFTEAQATALTQALRCLGSAKTAELAPLRIVLCDPAERPAAAADGAWQAEDASLWLMLGCDWRALWRLLRALDSSSLAASAAVAAGVAAELPALAIRLGVHSLTAGARLSAAQLVQFCASIRATLPSDSVAPSPLGFGVVVEPAGFEAAEEATPSGWCAAERGDDGHLMCAYAAGQRTVRVSCHCAGGTLLRFLHVHGAAIDAHRRQGDACRAELAAVQDAFRRATTGWVVTASAQLEDEAALAATRRLLDAAAELRCAVGEACPAPVLLLVANASPLRWAVLEDGTLCAPATFRVAELIVRLPGRTGKAS